MAFKAGDEVELTKDVMVLEGMDGNMILMKGSMARVRRVHELNGFSNRPENWSWDVYGYSIEVIVGGVLRVETNVSPWCVK